MSLKKVVILAALFCCGIAAAQKPAAAPAYAPKYDPRRAVQDISVGKFYMDRGDIHGAIARFKDAIEYKPNYAEPCLLLGQAYEKKGDPVRAVDYYQRYLKILPRGRDSRKVRERIAKLEEKIKQEKSAARNPSGS
ncbi:MAG TPA: tetratricopeptide repeat protein [Candidatus Limnocylindrales bacterium]|nr:tetratricopeptide repeat protein [Candidatus Limnocylindrales bacterium]